MFSSLCISSGLRQEVRPPGARLQDQRTCVPAPPPEHAAPPAYSRVGSTSWPGCRPVSMQPSWAAGCCEQCRHTPAAAKHCIAVSSRPGWVQVSCKRPTDFLVAKPPPQLGLQCRVLSRYSCTARPAGQGGHCAPTTALHRACLCCATRGQVWRGSMPAKAVQGADQKARTRAYPAGA